MKKIRKAALLILPLVLLLTAAGCGREETTPAREETPPIRTLTVFDCLDTVITFKIYTRDESLPEAAHAECRRLHALFARNEEGSDVWKINHADGQSVEVSDDTVRILETAARISELSGGAFDVTIAPASTLWDFHAEDPQVPEAAALAEAAERIDYTKIRIDGNTVTLPAGMMIDLGGIAKGYIADAVKQMLVDRGVKHAILSFGGNIIAIGIKPEGTPWRVGIQDIDAPTGTSMLVSLNYGGSTVTSGIYERGFEEDGVWYHHILSSETGWPVQNELASVTIFTENSMEGDALSTAVFALGTEKGTGLIESLENTEAVLIDRNRNVTMTSGAGKYFEN
ncbi:MAG: FAD:protein FMN transferase [Clostridiales bacterium]|nr:FAD:protein FMN transferase [Clostridiales bacterium]